jgi:hypothetical protein
MRTLHKKGVYVSGCQDLEGDLNEIVDNIEHLDKD